MLFMRTSRANKQFANSFVTSNGCNAFKFREMRAILNSELNAKFYFYYVPLLLGVSNFLEDVIALQFKSHFCSTHSGVHRGTGYVLPNSNKEQKTLKKSILS